MNELRGLSRIPSERPILYLDIDGTLLRRRVNNNNLHDAYEVDQDALAFLSWAVDHFECRWLSTRCRNGNTEGALRAFRHALGVTRPSEEWARVLGAIGVAAWSVSKVEGIELAHAAGWFWVDDAPAPDDVAVLIGSGAVDRLVVVDPTRESPLQFVRQRIEAGFLNEDPCSKTCS